MTKGENLDKLLTRAENIQQEMDAVFTQYNLKRFDFANLPTPGWEEWEQLFRLKDLINECVLDILTKKG